MQFIIIGIDTGTIRRAKLRLALKRVTSQIVDEIPRLVEKILGFIDWYASELASNGNDEDDSPEDETKPKPLDFSRSTPGRFLWPMIPWYTSGFT